MEIFVNWTEYSYLFVPKRSRRPRGLRRRPAFALMLVLRVWIPSGAWMSVCCECCVVSGTRICFGLITGTEDSYCVWCVSLIVNVKPQYWGDSGPLGAVAPWGEGVELAPKIDSPCTVKIMWRRYRPGVAQRVGRVIALLFHDPGTRRGWVVSSTPRPQFTPGKYPVPILQEAGWGGPQGRSGRAENLVPTGIRSRTVQPVVSRYTDWATRPTATVQYIY